MGTLTAVVSTLPGPVGYSWYLVSTIGPKTAVMGQCFLVCNIVSDFKLPETSFWRLDS